MAAYMGHFLWLLGEVSINEMHHHLQKQLFESHFIYFLLFFCFFCKIDIIARLEELCFNMMLKNMFIIQSTKWPAAVTAEYCSPMSTL